MKTVLVISYTEDSPYTPELSCPSGDFNVGTALRALGSSQMALLKHEDQLSQNPIGPVEVENTNL